MSSNKMRAEDGVVMDTITSVSSPGANEFVSRRVVPDPLRLPYSRVVHEVRKEIILATYEQRPELPKSATAPERHRERNGVAAAPDPMAVRERIQGLLLDGHLVARICAASGRIHAVSLDVFAHGSKQVFDAMEQGRPITVPATLENLIVDLDPARDLRAAASSTVNSGMVTGTVFFYEDEFYKACAEDPVEIEYTHQAFVEGIGPAATTGQARLVIASAVEGIGSAAQCGTAQAIVSNYATTADEPAPTPTFRDMGGRPVVYIGLDKTISRLFAQKPEGFRYTGQNKMVDDIECAYGPDLKSLKARCTLKKDGKGRAITKDPSRQTFIDYAKKDAAYPRVKSLRSR